MENENKVKSKNVETYTADMVRAISNDKQGLIKKIISEEEEHEARNKNLSPTSIKNRMLVFVSYLFIFLAVAVLIFIVFFYGKESTVSIVPQSVSLIFTDQTDFRAVDGLDKDQIAQTISNQFKNTKVKIGGVNGIYLTENKKVVSFRQFLALIKGSLVLGQDNLISDNFLLGAFKSGLSSVSPNIGDPFILLNVRSFTDVFPIMLGWENKMLHDLHGFFGVEITSDTNYLFTKDFEDGVVANKNGRMLKDKDGKIVLMYVYADDSHIIITNSEMAAKEVILRLASSQIKK